MIPSVAVGCVTVLVTVAQFSCRRAADRPPDQTASSEWTATSGSMDCPLTQGYFGRANWNSYMVMRRLDHLLDAYCEPEDTVSGVLQNELERQLRKKGLGIVWTAESEASVRIRFTKIYQGPPFWTLGFLTLLPGLASAIEVRVTVSLSNGESKLLNERVREGGISGATIKMAQLVSKHVLNLYDAGTMVLRD